MTRTALITGANGGIGQEMARSFKLAGYRVIATDRQSPRPDLEYDEFVVADIQKSVENEAYCRGVFDEIRGKLSNDRLAALVNNAAVQILQPVDRLSREDWFCTLNTNLVGPFVWIQACMPHLRKANGSVVNISSIHATQTKANFVAYATSKAALSALTRNMAIEFGPDIRINAIEPAAVKTHMLMEGFKGDMDKLAQLNKVHPIGRIAEPAEVARIAVFLCSKEASFLQGSVIPASGGIHGRLTDPD